MTQIRIVLCDDQDIVTEGMGVILRTVRDFAVVGVAHDGAAAVDLVAELQPDVVLMDLRMPILNGIQATRKIRERFPQTRVLVLTTYDDDEWVFDAIRAGAAGYLLKDTGREQIIAAIRGTAAGATHVDPNVAGKLFQHIAQAAAPPPAPFRPWPST
ncbi:MAG: response regulator transcription factor [Caldilineaceae bacterium]